MSTVRTCESCGKDIPRQTTWSLAYYAKRRFCNKACERANVPDIASDYTIDERGCWIWQGRIDRNGYGKAYDATRPKGQRVDWAHRVSYRRHVGEIPADHDLDHTCENTRCINPSHLDPVTRIEHARRTMQRLGKDITHANAATLRHLGLTYREIATALGYADKGSAALAVNAAISKGLVDADDIPRQRHLTDADREDIRALHALGVPQGEIAAWYEIDNSQISRICNGQTSGHSASHAAKAGRARQLGRAS